MNSSEKWKHDSSHNSKQQQKFDGIESTPLKAISECCSSQIEGTLDLLPSPLKKFSLFSCHLMLSSQEHSLNVNEKRPCQISFEERQVNGY